MASVSHEKVHERAIIIDAVSPLIRRRQYIDLYARGGFTCVAATVAHGTDAGGAVKDLGDWLRFMDSRADVILVRTAADIERAKREGKVGLVFHFQGTDQFENDLNLVEAYKALGVRMVQLTYNVKNRVGDGCEERTDAGLSRFGIALVERLNANGIVVDCAHTGLRTTMDAIEASTQPVIISHANARAVFPCARNIPDDLAKAIARKGGVVGINAVPYFVIYPGRPTLDQLIAHVDHFVKVMGIDHVGLGFDYFDGQQPFADDATADRIWKEAVDSGRWSPANYPRPPHYYPEGLDTPAELRNLTKRLLERGYSAEDTTKILGGNWLRVFRTVWGG
jgi:membrane dipeptidase